jgi:hypothetical protein
MKKIIYLILTFHFSFFILNFSFGGNEDRSGQAGASELLINPWARSSGWGSVNTGCVRGMEAMYGNIAGIAFTNKTDIIFSHSIYLKGSDISINAFGFAQKAGATGVIALGVMSMNLGDIPITTVENPDGGLGNYSPKLMNINVAYAKAFSNSIYGGINFKIISESISDVSAQGLALDAGIQYVTGEQDNIKFGISMKNVGTRLKYSGNGLTFRGIIPGASSESTISQRTQDFELPSLVNIGAAYDFFFADKTDKADDTKHTHTLTAAVNFTSNSFTKDQYSAGLEYNFKGYLYLRGGFTFEKDIFKDAPERTTVFTGPSAGFSVDIPMNKQSGSKFSLDYSYRSTDPFQGTHSIGVRVSL